MKQVVCIGAMLVDELFYCNGPVLAATSNPATVKRAAGGVMRNIVHHLALLEIPVQFITVVGNDADGQWLKENSLQAGIDISTTITVNCNTGKYTAILNPDGSLYTAAASNPCESYLTISLLEQQEKILSAAGIIVADTNLETAVLEWLISYCRQRDIRLFIEPVSVSKAKKLSAIAMDGLFMITPNEDELPSLSKHDLPAEPILQELLQRGVKYIWLRKGSAGSEMISLKSRYPLPAPVVTVKDITGAGDAALAAWIAAHWLGKDEKECLLAAHTMAAAALQVEGAIDTGINQEKLFNAVKKYYPNEQ
jgi:pseudouridine kinase